MGVSEAVGYKRTCSVLRKGTDPGGAKGPEQMSSYKTLFTYSKGHNVASSHPKPP